MGWDGRGIEGLGRSSELLGSGDDLLGGSWWRLIEEGLPCVGWGEVRVRIVDPTKSVLAI